MYALQVVTVSHLALRTDLGGEMKGYPCLYSYNSMQSTSSRRPQTDYACSRVGHVLRLKMSTVDSTASVGPSRVISRAMAISAAASCICVAPRRSQQVVFDVLFACASEK